jgi:hypothetical protein
MFRVTFHCGEWLADDMKRARVYARLLARRYHKPVTITPYCALGETIVVKPRR